MVSIKELYYDAQPSKSQDYFSEFHFMDFSVKTLTASSMARWHNIYHNAHVSRSKNSCTIHSSGFLSWEVGSLIPNVLKVLTTFTWGLRSPRGLNVVCTLQTLGTGSSVTQPSNPKYLQRWHQRFRNLKFCKVYVVFYTDVWQVLRHSSVHWIWWFKLRLYNVFCVILQPQMCTLQSCTRKCNCIHKFEV